MAPLYKARMSCAAKSESKIDCTTHICSRSHHVSCSACPGHKFFVRLIDTTEAKAIIDFLTLFVCIVSNNNPCKWKKKSCVHSISCPKESHKHSKCSQNLNYFYDKLVAGGKKVYSFNSTTMKHCQRRATPFVHVSCYFTGTGGGLSKRV